MLYAFWFASFFFLSDWKRYLTRGTQKKKEKEKKNAVHVNVKIFQCFFFFSSHAISIFISIVFSLDFVFLLYEMIRSLCRVYIFLSNFHRFFFHSDCAHLCMDNRICNVDNILCISDALILLAAALVQLVHGRKHVYKHTVLLLLLPYFLQPYVYTSTTVCMLRIFFFVE